MSEVDLQLSGVVKRYGSLTVLDHLDLTVPGGSLMAVLGPSGSGKTTLLRLIAGFEPVDAGEVLMAGRTMSARGYTIPPEQRRIGIVPQDGVLFPHLSVAANIGFGLSPSERRSGRVEELLELVGLTGLGTRRPHQLSGGQQQRVALARALAPRPGLVLLDEPFSALDAGLRASLRGDVRRILQSTGTTALLVTHDQEEALSLADQIAVLQAGRIVQVADPVTLYTSPVNATVARFIGEATLLSGWLSGGVVECLLGTLPVHADSLASTGPCMIMVRPEQVRLTTHDGWPARVQQVTYFGHDALALLELDTDDGRGLTLLARIHGLALPQIGDHLYGCIDGPVRAWPDTDVSAAQRPTRLLTR